MRKKEKITLICDIHDLNKGVKTNCSVFPTPNEVMQSLRVTFKFFIKADMLQEYSEVEHAQD